MTTARTLAETVAEGGQAKEDKGDQVKEEALQAEWAKTLASVCDEAQARRSCKSADRHVSFITIGKKAGFLRRG